MLHQLLDVNTDNEDGCKRIYTTINGIIKYLYIIQSMSRVFYQKKYTCAPVPTDFETADPVLLRPEKK
jgi:hypothetical protein